MVNEEALSPGRSVCLVGTIPPPIGGVSVHVARLASLCTQSGYRTGLYDFHPGPNKRIPEGCAAEGPASRLIAAAFYCFARTFKEYDVVHVHVSRLRAFLFLHAGLLLRRRLLKRFVITFHSGSISKDLARISSLERLGLSQILDGCAKVIAVGSQQAVDLRKWTKIIPDQLVVIPAYLAFAARTKAALPDSLTIPETGQSRRIGVASGYGAARYGWRELLHAIEMLPSEWQWIFCFYNEYEEPYYQELRMQCAGVPNVHCLNELDSDSFHSVLQIADTYVRPTTVDGDSIALREAMALGLHCVASDVVPRPRGVVTYCSTDGDALYKALYALPIGREAAQSDDNGKRILAIYEAVNASH